MLMMRKSTSSGCFCLGFVMVSWKSRKQDFVALCITEVEYMAACLVSCEIIWLCKTFDGSFDDMKDLTVILCNKLYEDYQKTHFFMEGRTTL